MASLPLPTGVRQSPGAHPGAAQHCVRGQELPGARGGAWQMMLTTSYDATSLHTRGFRNALDDVACNVYQALVPSLWASNL
jgi:hypothetical protein